MSVEIGFPALRTVVFSNGERVPVLVDSMGMPCFVPSMYLLTCRRTRGLAANTLTSDAACIRVLLCWATVVEVDLEHRFASCEYLSLAEVDDLARSLRLSFRGLAARREPAHTGAGIRLQTLQQPLLDEVSSATTAGRFHVLRNYLKWVADYCEPSAFESELARSAARDRRVQMLNWFDARGPHAPSEPLDPRLGLSPDEVDLLLSACDPESRSNPWASAFVRDRNRLAVRMLLELGMRKGELLGLSVSDINFQSNTVAIRRRPDDRADPRVIQPNAKTRGRVLPVEDELISLIRNHVLQFRRDIPNARLTGVLFISSSGRPLSGSGLNAVFDQIRTSCSGLPKKLSAHLLRHTWNDNYSELMQKNKTSEAEEIRTRSYLMGWSERSGTAARYTRRFVRQAAGKASLALQKRLRKTSDE